MSICNKISAMKEFDQLLAILDRLIGPDGCPWDQRQTMQSLRETVLEEACELIEAINLENDHHILEELGDLLLNVVFFCKVAEKEKRFRTEEMIKDLNDKLIRRHPHIFGEAKVNGIEDLWKQWHSIKAQERGKDQRKSVMDGFPKDLPALAYANKMLKKMHKAHYPIQKPSEGLSKSEEEFGRELFDLVQRAQEHGVEPEQALRKVISQEENSFRTWEEKA